MAIKRPVRKLLGKKMGDHIICHPNQDTCASECGCYRQLIRDNRHNQDLPLTKL